MSQNIYKSIFNSGLTIRAFVASSLLVFMSFAAVPRLGTADVPELPRGDGTGDTPDMLIKLVPNNLGSVANRADNLRLSSLRGRVVLLDLFWSQCPHCEEHAPHIVGFYNQYRQRGFTVLGLASDQQNKIDDVKTFVRKAKINYPVGFMTTEIVAYYAEGSQVPQMILFGPDGKMVKRITGWTDKIGQEMRQAIEAQLAKLPTVKPGSKASSKSSPRKIKQV
jgi:thiol-disulfide isomerase/thioredoxin